MPQEAIAVVNAALYWSGLVAANTNDLNLADQRLAAMRDVSAVSGKADSLEARIKQLRDAKWEHIAHRAELALSEQRLEDAAGLIRTAAQAGAEENIVVSLQDRLVRAKLLTSFEPGQRLTASLPQAPETVVLPGVDENALPIAMSRTEVTVGQFRQFVEATGYISDAERLQKTTVYDERSGELKSAKKLNWRHDFSGDAAKDEQPVIHVSWNDAKAYATWLRDVTGEGFRLPTDAEFDHALRAGSQTRYWWGNASPTERVANVAGAEDEFRGKWQWPNGFDGYADGFWGPAPVGSFAANPFGLADMGGNVMEWVEDCASGGCEQRLVRDASWASAPDRARSEFKVGAAAESASCLVGFRVVRDLAEDTRITLLTAE